MATTHQVTPSKTTPRSRIAPVMIILNNMEASLHNTPCILRVASPSVLPMCLQKLSPVRLSAGTSEGSPERTYATTAGAIMYGRIG